MDSISLPVKIYDVFWEGPYSFNTVFEHTGESRVTRSHCLYQIYGDHPAYGRDVLLYIGKTERDIRHRLSEHYTRFSNQCEEIKIFLASFGEFTSWEARKNRVYGPVSENNDMLNAIESLLIYAHQPAYNSKSLYTPLRYREHFRIFNSGRRKSLMPEISTQFYSVNNA